MRKGTLSRRLIYFVSVAFLLVGCASGDNGDAGRIQTIVASTLEGSSTQVPSTAAQPAGFSNAGAELNGSDSDNAGNSHAGDTQPDYTIVFPQDSVNRIDIAISSDAWANLQAEMTAEFGEQGSNNQSGAAPGDPGQMPGANQGGNQPPAQGGPGGGGAQAGAPPQGAALGENPQGANGEMAALDFGDTSYVSSAVTFNGETWQSVGFRYSGNSTLQSSWRSGTAKISFRLDFDEFEDVDPATENQRFYGFKQIAFKSNAMDDSYLREKVVADIFRESGVVASQTAFYEVYIDYGEGSKYLGLYTAVEIVDDTVIQTQFEDDNGNVYKPEGAGAAFVVGTFSETSFEKQTNQDEADWSDIQAVFDALNSDLRTSDPQTWRANLEAVFDVDAFIRWLAVDTIVQNWDTYGSMAHNYYLYTNPVNSLVTWIPWDNNMALSEKPANQGGNGVNRGGPGGSVRSLDLSTVSDKWPLIRYLMDDPTYLAMYRQALQETIQTAFLPDQLAATYQKYHDLIAPYVQNETQESTQLSSIESFNNSVAGLIQHAQNRYNAVAAYLQSQ